MSTTCTPRPIARSARRTSPPSSPTCLSLPSSPLYAVGFSLGAGMLLRHLGTQVARASSARWSSRPPSTYAPATSIWRAACARSTSRDHLSARPLSGPPYRAAHRADAAPLWACCAARCVARMGWTSTCTVLGAARWQGGPIADPHPRPPPDPTDDARGALGGRPDLPGGRDAPRGHGRESAPHHRDHAPWRAHGLHRRPFAAQVDVDRSAARPLPTTL